MLKMAPLDCAINELWQCWRRTGHLPSFSSSPQGIDSARVPTPQNLPSKAKQMLMPGGQPGGGGGGGRAWGGELIVFVGSGVGHLTFCLILFSQVWGYLNLSLPDVEIFDCRLGRRRLRPNMFPASTLHACAIRFEKIRKSWRPMRTSEGWVDFTVLSSNFVCFSVFLINWTS